jgi:lysophospholipase
MSNNRLRSAADVAEEQLRAGAKRLQAQLATAEKVAEKAAEKLAAKARERLPAPADAASGVATKARDAVGRRRSRPGGSRPAPVMAPPGATPDESWTVADLRAEAKRRGLGGYSRKTKAQLLADLTRR